VPLEEHQSTRSGARRMIANTDESLSSIGSPAL
jgi:hypothetical protein